MFNNLLESKPKKEKRGGGTVTSVVVHSILVRPRRLRDGECGDQERKAETGEDRLRRDS